MYLKETKKWILGVSAPSCTELRWLGSIDFRSWNLRNMFSLRTMAFHTHKQGGKDVFNKGREEISYITLSSWVEIQGSKCPRISPTPTIKPYRSTIMFCNTIKSPLPCQAPEVPICYKEGTTWSVKSWRRPPENLSTSCCQVPEQLSCLGTFHGTSHKPGFRVQCPNPAHLPFVGLKRLVIWLSSLANPVNWRWLRSEEV